MNYFLPTYDDAVKMTGGTEDLFYSSESIVDGYKTVTFNYRLAQYNDFINPPSNIKNGFEMRGLTFVFNLDGTLYKRYLLLDKFFNLNQVPSTLYVEVKGLEIDNVYSKEDGSVITFIKLPNGKVLAKTKMSFEADQAIGANLVYNNNDKLKSFIDWTLDNDIVAVFEYIAPDNRVVLKYYERDLILLRLRDNNTGKYLKLDDFSDKLEGISIAKKINHTLDELIDLAKTETDIEGWVVQFVSGRMIKIKTEWYFTLHGLTEDIHILIKDSERYDSYRSYGYGEDDISNRLGYKDIKYKPSFFKKTKSYEVDFFEDDGVHFEEFNYNGTALKVHHPIEIISHKIEMIKKRTTASSKHSGDLYRIFESINFEN